MPQTLIDALAREVFSRFPPDRPHAPAEFDSVPLLLARALRQRLHDEVDTRLHAVAPWVGDGTDRWVSAARSQARYPADAWREAVPAEAERIVSTLIAPSREMPRWAVPGGEADVDEVLDRMRQFGAYPYLTEIVGRYADKKDLDTIDAEAFEQLLARIDRRLAAELDVDGWMALLSPLYDLVESVPELESALSGLVLGEVFGARGLPGVGSRLVESPGLTRPDLRHRLREILNADADDAVLEAALRGGALDDDDDAPEASGEADGGEEAEPVGAEPVDAEPVDAEQEESDASGEMESGFDEMDADVEPVDAEPETEEPEADEQSEAAEVVDAEPVGDLDTADDDPPYASGADEPTETPEADPESRAEPEPPAEADADATDAEQVDDETGAEGPETAETDADLDAEAELTAEPEASGDADILEVDEDEASGAEEGSSDVAPGAPPVDLSDPPSLPNPFSDLDPSVASADDAPGRSKTGALGGIPIPPRPVSTPEAPEPVTPEPAAEEAQDVESEPQASAEPEPLWVRLAREQRKAAGEPEPDTPEATSGGTPLWKQFASGGASAETPEATLADSIFDGDTAPSTLHETIADAPKDEVRPEDHEVLVLGDAVENGPWYIETLFDGDEDAYAHVLALLVDAPTWTDATQIIGREVFRRYKINIYSEPAVSFTGAVESRYQRG